ncbi:SH3 domain-containing protein [Thiospirochaeta perfilievii]|uniref:SH3 domain-containing protein n=1 Tax=Thiospirochaeta perfilievii TaxID=252967 RepID=A0A5C1Q8A5_9SPIO|nr:SH3 domain-containing protein [Thiospirochaeta perfilievii]QEN03189.1 SH3 domain-containing protein [Thiospirochaeta perfilievii]
MLKRIILILILSISVVNIFSDELEYKNITVKSAQIRQRPSFLGKILFTLNYTDEVAIYETKNGWSYIGFNSNKGWIHNSALSDKKLILKKSDSKIEDRVSGSEVALAGKGFNSEIEENYKSQNNLDYYWIDQMEEYQVDIESLIDFSYSYNLNIGGLE